MTILKIQKRHNPFVQIDREAIQDSSLSWKARGLLAYLLSMPSNWNIRISDLINRAPDGRDAVYSIFKELKAAGYLIHFRLRDEHGRLSLSEYHVFETPQLESDLAPNQEKPELVENKNLMTEIQLTPNRDFPDLVKPDPENPDAYIINTTQIKQITNKTEEAGKCNELGTEQTSSPVIEKTTSAADFILPESDLLINDSLSLPQMYCLKNMVKKIHSNAQLKQYSLDKLFELLEYSILSPKSYPKAGQDFTKKLNFIHKSIQNGTWTPSADFVLKKQAEAEKARLASIKAEEEKHKRQEEAFDEYCAEHFISFLNATPPELVRAWMELWRGHVKDPFTLKLIKQAEVEGFKHPAVRGLFKAFLLTYLPDVYAMPSGAFKEIRQSRECVT